MTDSSDEHLARAVAMMDEAGAKIVAGVARLGPVWLDERVARIVEAWDGWDDSGRAAARAELHAAAASAGIRVAAELRELFATAPGEQRTTPLEIVRGLRREPTAVLAAAGVPAVVRDDFDERSWPDDRYDLIPRTLADLGDPELGGYLMAWGVAKAKVLRGR